MFKAVFDLSTLDGANGFTISSGYSESDIIVGTGGDFNGDGIADAVLGYGGGSCILFGRKNGFPASFDLTTLDGSNGFTVPSVNQDGLGSTVNTAGDINGDGIEDVLLGAPEAGNGRGASYVIFGQKNGFPASFNLTTLNGSNGFTIPGLDQDNALGTSVGTAKDVNGDGLDDVLLGASYGNNAQGAGYILFGQKNEFPARFDLTTLNGTNGFSISGLNGDTTNLAVSTAGDINGDGIGDVVLGGSGVGVNDDEVGACYIIFGQKNGFPASFDLTTLNGSNGFVVPGLNNNDELGYSVSTVGDINGDGISDIVLGADYANEGRGTCYIIFGQKKGFPASFDLTTLNGSNGFTVSGLNTEDLLGNAVSAAGDINGDGLSDVLLASNGESGCYIIFGRKEGFPVHFDLTTLNGSNGFTIPGPLSGSSLGDSVTAGGDINGDGVEDVLLSNSYHGSEGYVIFGKSLFSPTLWSNNLLALQGVPVILTPQNLNATDLRTPSPELLFTAYTIAHGRFEYVNNPGATITQFYQYNVSTAAVQFRTDNSGTAPSYALSVKNNMNLSTPAPCPATITFHDAPVLQNNRLLIANGQSVSLTPSNLSATEKYTPAQDLLFTASNIQHGQFQLVTPKFNITQFGQQNVTNGIIQFVHDGSNIAPNYTISVSDGLLSSSLEMARIVFHDAPIILNNRLSIVQGQSVILSSGDLSATEVYTPPEELIFIVSQVQHGQFHLLNATGHVTKAGVPQFAQQNITNGIIQFTQDGSAMTPSYSVSVGDGHLSSGTPVGAQITFKKTGGSSDPSLIDKVGGWGGIAGIIGGGILLICLAAIMSGMGMWYKKWKTRPTIKVFGKVPDPSDAEESSFLGANSEIQPLLEKGVPQQNSTVLTETLSETVREDEDKELEDCASNFNEGQLSDGEEGRAASFLSETSPNPGRFQGALFHHKSDDIPLALEVQQYSAGSTRNLKG